MAQLLQTDAIGQKSSFRLHQLVCFRGIVPKSLVLLIGVLLLSESVAGTPTQFSPLVPTALPGNARGGRGGSSIAQQPATTSPEATKAAAERIFQEGMQLFQQGTGESLRGAIAKWEEALRLYRVVGDKKGEATALLGIGRAYNALEEKQKALEFFNQSLSLFRAVGNKMGEAGALNNIGVVYYDLGEKQKALEFYNQSLPLRREVGDKVGEAFTLSNIGRVYNDLGEKQKALEYYNESLPLTRAVGNKAVEAATLNNIGQVHSDLGEKQKALEYYNESLPLSRAVGDRAGEAITLSNIGLVYDALGEKQKALEFYNQSLPLSRAVGNRAGEARTLYNFALLERNRGNLNAALTQIESAINIIEDLRTKIASQQLRASYFATVQDYYQLYIDLLMQLHKTNPDKGYDAMALHISERSKARTLIELLAEARVNIGSGADSQLLEQERNLQQQLNAAEFSRVKLLEGSYTEKQLTLIKQRIENLISQLDQVQAQIRVKSPAYAAISQPGAFTLTLPQIQQQVLDDNTLLLQYSLGKERSYLWAVTKTGITSYELPKRADIEAAATEFYEQLQSESINSPEAGQKLSQMLLAPVANQLGNKRLLIVGEGDLQKIPFAALPVAANAQISASYTPLLVNNEIVSLPSASTLAVQRNQLNNRPKAAKTLAIFADPVFTTDDQRLTSRPQQSNTVASDATRSIEACNTSETERLPFSNQEAEKIAALIPANQQFQALGFQASRATANSPALAQYRIVHFATHACVNNEHPALSGLILSLFDEQGNSTDGFLRLSDIYNLNLPAELVVLSACQTGIGKDVRGDGLIGLTRGFMYAGAKRVVVSLWRVSDVATSQLMQKYYQQMLQKGLNPVQALRAAQLEMLQNEQWKAPYYWAAFIVQGEWND
ncbi:MAG TPA: hypothetical protein DDW76_09975 [Cyanobacteria bacterium UBA11369]|nr:hypothetical protein [Cyanobacteria bacterium UBA11371]HBE49101.1 hypothetical protein [Cyanobacteria bacterium UBA11369]